MNFLQTIKTSRKHQALLFLAALFALQTLFISPIGEFALNDDWVHTWSAQHLAETGELKMMPWAGATFYTPILYGAGLIKLFGFSFSILRISTLLLSFALVLGLFFFLQKKTGKTSLAIIGALALWSNPIFFNLSYTFMTDIPALLLIFLAFLSYTKTLEGKNKQSAWWFLLGTSLSIIGFYTRQTNILLIIPFGLYVFYNRKEFGGLFRVLWSFGIPILGGACIYAWLYTKNLLPSSASTHFLELNLDYLKHITLWIWQYSLIVGISLLPITIGFTKPKQIIRNPKFLLLASGMVAVSLFLNEVFADRLWHVGNIISVHGLGPSQVINGTQTLLITPTLQKLFTILCALATAMLIWLCFEKKNQYIKEKTVATRLALWFCLLYIITVVSVLGFDRYMLPITMICLLFLFVKKQKDKISLIPSTLFILVFASISLSQTHHYLAWNQARWKLGNSALNQNIPANHIDGGYEWNGWHSYWSAAESGLTEGVPTSPWWIRVLFFDNTEEYIISFSPIPDYDTIEVRQLRSLNPNSTLYLLHRQQE